MSIYIYLANVIEATDRHRVKTGRYTRKIKCKQTFILWNRIFFNSFNENFKSL